MKSKATEEEINTVVQRIEEIGFKVHLSKGVETTLIGAIGHLGDRTLLEDLKTLPGVQEAVPISKPYKLASRTMKEVDTVVKVGNVEIGGGKLAVIAGPCSVESYDQIMESGKIVSEFGGHILRGGAFKPRTSPYAFQGLGEEGLKYLVEVREKYGLPIDTEVLSLDHLKLVADNADIIQIGTRNAQNFSLITAAARTGKPILLKRGMSGTIEEWLLAAEYILNEGNPNVILCERGIKGYDKFTRNTLDLAAVAVAKRESHLPVIVDPSHATGDRSLVPVLARAALVAGADGIMVEVHPNPDRALSDGAQSLTAQMFREMMADLQLTAGFIGKEM